MPAHSRYRPYVVPAVIAAAAMLAGLGGDPARQLLRYQRDALASGQLWRLITGHLAHLGPSHMLMNVGALGILALILEKLLQPRDWVLVGLTAALVIDAGLYWGQPSIAWYVGLSGVLHGLWSAACVRGMDLRRPEAIPLTLLLLAKLGYEWVVGPVQLTGNVAGGAVVTQAHAWGALGGVLWPLLAIAIRRRQASI
jgi:rhomboid family GlyGly-CTERM serine protease